MMASENGHWDAFDFVDLILAVIRGPIYIVRWIFVFIGAAIGYKIAVASVTVLGSAFLGNIAVSLGLVKPSPIPSLIGALLGWLVWRELFKSELQKKRRE